MSTMAFSVTIPAGFDQWNRQVHCFIRGGVLVTRLLDSTLGPSNNVVDLALYLLQKTSRLNAAQIDSALMMDAARFTNTNGLWYNGAEDQSANLRDWLKGTLDYFLLRSVRINGKETFKPLLPYIPATGAINTDPVEWVFTFTEEHIVPDSFEINYIPLTERKPFCALMLWRQQPTDDIGIIRTSEVRYPGTALDGPFEQYDLSKFCASEDHAWKAGAYIISRRRHITHTLTIQVKPDAFNPTLVDGDIVRVRLDRVTSVGAASVHNYLYEVDRITKSIGGDIQIELTHFPVDGELRSVVALEVDSAVGGGVLLETGKTGVSCDVNSSTDDSVPDEEFTDDTDIDDGDGGFDEGGEVLPPDDEPDNPDDELDDQLGVNPNFVVWFDSESAQVFGPSDAVITLDSSDGDYETTEHLGELAFAPPPGVIVEETGTFLYHEWAVAVPDALTSGDFTIEAWARSSTAAPPSGGFSGAGIALVWGDSNVISMDSSFGTISSSDIVLFPAQHIQSMVSQFDDTRVWNAQGFGATVQGWKHLCYQRISGTDVFHYHGTRVDLTLGEEPLPSPRPISGAQLFVSASNIGTAGVALGQVRATVGVRYGFGTFTPPSIQFYATP
jgi:hypothetical protein